MAFVIKNIEGSTIEIVQRKLQIALDQSRFTADVSISIHDVRLKESKRYCGNHPFACPIDVNHFRRSHKKHKYLEGADWVAFNDMINDVLDDLGVSANVRSSLVIIRKGRNRCVKYNGHQIRDSIFSAWDKEGVYVDRIKESKKEMKFKASFPEGTPGIASFLINF